VLFLYPRGRHEKTAENPNVVDAIIAKHRNGPVGAVSLFFRPEHASFTALEVRRDTVQAAVAAQGVVAR
jgi:replicative DNA helicase